MCGTERWRTMEKLEKEIERALGIMVRSHGGLCLKWVCPGWAGVPDRIVLLPGGRVFFVELKRPSGGKRSELQGWWARKLQRLGFRHLWVQNHEDIIRLEAQIMEVRRHG